jgi:surface polysaccharide O-acyltransferase-like enzyme
VGADAVAISRDSRVDALKGFAIACVVLYHGAGQYYDYSPATGVVYYQWTIFLRAFLFSFMLPLFAFLSGYVTARPGGFRPRTYFVRRTLGLLVPYLVWESFYGPGLKKGPAMLSSAGAFIGYYYHVFSNPHYEGRMWYLLVLWIALMCLGLARLAGDRTWVLVVSIPVVWLIGTPVAQFHWLRWVYAFVAIGVLWRRCEDRLLPRLTTLGWIGGIAFAPLWWLSEPEPIALPRLMRWAGAGMGHAVQTTILPLLLVVLGLCAVAAILAVSYHVPKWAEQGLAYLGVLSLGIYVTHFYLVEMWRHMPAWFLPINAALAIALAVAATLALGAWRVSAWLFLGERWVPKRRHLGDVQTETL